MKLCLELRYGEQFFVASPASPDDPQEHVWVNSPSQQLCNANGLCYKFRGDAVKMAHWLVDTSKLCHKIFLTPEYQPPPLLPSLKC